jgi:hypothetical protein
MATLCLLGGVQATDQTKRRTMRKAGGTAMTRWNWSLLAAMAATLAISAASTTAARTYPSGPIRIFTGFQAGGTAITLTSHVVDDQLLVRVHDQIMLDARNAKIAAKLVAQVRCGIPRRQHLGHDHRIGNLQRVAGTASPQ